MSDLLIRAEGLTKAYGSKVALQDVDLSIGRGRIIGLLGPNGSGKTTLIKLANGLLTPSEGEILICGAAPGRATHGLVSRALSGHSAYGANAAATLCGILAGVIVYAILVVALRILRAEDLKTVPHGAKLAKVLHLR